MTHTGPVYGLWQGGPNYRPSSVHDGDLEMFGSVEAAQTALNDRERLGHTFPQTFYNVDKAHSTDLTPCVQDSEMHVYFAVPEDGEPDLILTVEPTMRVCATCDTLVPDTADDTHPPEWQCSNLDCGMWFHVVNGEHDRCPHCGSTPNI